MDFINLQPLGMAGVTIFPVFVANGFYKNRTEFLNRHAVYSRFTKFPKVDRYIDCKHLVELRDKIMVRMEVERETEQHHITIQTSYDVDLERYIMQIDGTRMMVSPYKTSLNFVIFLEKLQTATRVDPK